MTNPTATQLVQSITRTFDAPRNLVWQSLTDPERLKRWCGPKDFTSPVCQVDLRVGGRYLYCMRSAEGRDFWRTGTYREIVPPSLLICSDCFADADGKVVPATHYDMTSDFPVELQVIVSLVEDNGTTTLTLHHLGIPPGENRELCAVGWNQAFDKLAESFR